MLEYYTSEPILHLMTPTDMVVEFAQKTGQKPNPELYGRLIEEEYAEWRQEVFDKEAELKELADLVYVIYGYANAHGYKLDEAVRRVHKNNLGRCTQPDGSIKRREDGKIIKNKDYPKVYLGDLI
jgi:predicted HAD superfamily Cof-like phosphohydrolase